MLSSVQKHQWIFSQYCIWGDSLCILCVKYSYLWCVWKLTLPLPCEEILHELWRLVWAGWLSQTGSGGMMEPAGLRVSPASSLLILHSDPTLTITYNNYYQHHQDITRPVLTAAILIRTSQLYNNNVLCSDNIIESRFCKIEELQILYGSD